MLPRTVFLRRPAFLRRSVLAVVAGAAAAGLTSLSASAADDKPKPPAAAAALKPILVKLYAKTGFDDGIGRSALHDDLQNVVLPPKSKERKTADLKPTWWWSETIQEALYAGTNMVKQPGKTKDVVKSEFDCYPNGLDKISAKSPFMYRGPNGYSPKTPAPLLISIVDAKTNPKEWIEKSWAGFEDFQKQWVLVCVPESDVFDASKDKLALSRILAKMMQSFNVDPNRTFIEGVGAACKSAQISASLTLPDRIAGLILRNPQDSLAIENCGIFPTVVVRGPEGAEKASAVLASYKQVAGDTKGIELIAPDIASLEGPCQGLADWLKAAPPRELAKNYSWVALVDKDNNCPNPFTGSLVIRSPVKRGEVTKITKVTFSRETNTVDVQSTNLGEFIICMNDDLLDLDKEVEVFVNGKSVVKKVFERSARQMLVFADDWGEFGRLFPVQVPVIVPTVIAPAEKKPDDKKDGDGKDVPPGDKKDGEKK